MAAMAPLMSQMHGLWFGWPGDALSGEPEGRERLMGEWEREHGYVAVEIPARISRSFYEGYANDTLWPLLHGFPTRTVFAPESWSAYSDANQRFADAVLERHRKNDLIWAHDYQLLLVPGMIREDLKVEVHGDALTVSGERKVTPPEGYRVHRSERASRRFTRSFGLPCRVDAEKVTAGLKEGLLTITMEKHAEARPKQITVSAE
mgnify:CR=1 FL=1